ncbi:lysosomal acid lipase/cholesteryl ester hydrolase-like [Trichosurus vulpecula]|uniref:lysosomal acid lipase/cholesteryl ester hydrolase-like n=1 Tax=Trichosurus vulpecula TaxID=9337 RepID=UPI00186AF669|nr:lysosomal acid lipase/cholesteryl ester hydrolase-like [Trichosurus vulpecula]
MTTVSKVVLTREAGICYAAIPMVMDYDCWKEHEEEVSVDIVMKSLNENSNKATSLLLPAILVAELARYDLPASIGYIVKKKKLGRRYIMWAILREPLLLKAKLSFYGKNKYCTCYRVLAVSLEKKRWRRVKVAGSFMLFSTLPKAQKVKAFFALAPILYLKHIRSLPFLLLLQPPRPLLRSQIDVYVAHNPAGTSVQTILHFSQVVHEIQPPILQAYDWGSPKKNLAHYNQTIPSTYNLSKTKVPTALQSGLKDLLADPKDVSILILKIPKMIYHMILPSFDHFSFVFGIHAPQRIYYEIIKMIKGTP